MKAYRYDEITKEYKCEVICNIDYVASNKAGKTIYCLPINSTFIEPLEKKTNKAVIFNGEAWEYIQDYRGKRAYNDEGLLIITYLGKLQGSDKLLTKKQIQGLDDGTLIWKDGKIIENPGPTIPEQIEELERKIEVLNTKMLRDIIVLNNPNATEKEKQEAQTYFNNKLQQKEEIIIQINELKNT